MTDYDLIIRNGMIYDGSGDAPYRGDVAINGDRIAALGDIGAARGKSEIDANGLAVAPGFINMLSWSVESLIQDGRSQSEIRQGVTLEVMGEGFSFGPLNEAMKQAGTRGILGNYDIQYDIQWTTLGEYLEFLERRGVSCNVASFVGTSTLRIHAMGYDDRPPTDDELKAMCDLLRAAMEEGAMGLSSALIYPPASYAGFEELVELARAMGEYDGLYISHIRGEGRTLLEALDEFIETVDMARVRGEVYHLKASGRDHWDKMDEAIEILEEARGEGLAITADMYPYPYSGTGLSSCIPPWAHEGGHEALMARLRDPEARQRIKADMQTASDEWENMYIENGPENILLSGFRQESLKPLTGKTLAEVAAMRGTPPDDTLLDLVLEDDSRIFTMYFCMSEDNLRKQMALDWVSFCSDAESQAPEGVFLKSNPHPRAYGAFARVLAKYVREEQIIPLEAAVRRLTALPADNLRLTDRGRLAEGFYADIAIFDPVAIQDHATPTQPHQYATGMVHVLVNGVPVLKDGDHTGATPGRVVRGPGWGKKPFEALYPAALHPLLTLGTEYRGTYTEFNFKREHIPDLIRMATDTRLHFLDLDKPQLFAPAHTLIPLAQLGATEALEPITIMFDFPTPIIQTVLPLFYGAFGEASIPVLANHLKSWAMPFAKVGAAACLRKVAEDLPPIMQDVCETILLDQLRDYKNNMPYYNAALVTLLEDMESEAAQPVIRAAIKARAVADLNAEPGSLFAPPPLIEAEDDDGEDNQPRYFLPPAPAGFPQSFRTDRKAEKKKKAKRKMAAKTKKQQRRKKR